VDKDTVAPGEKVRISYKVVRHGNAPAIGEPATIRYGDLALQSGFQTRSMEGSFEYKVPDGATEGPYTIHVAWSPSGEEMGAYSSVTVTATKAPGGLAMGRADVLLLSLSVIALLVAVIAVVMALRMARGRRAQASRPAISPQYQPPPPSYAPPPAPPVQPAQPFQQPAPQQYSPPTQPAYQPPPQPAYTRRPPRPRTRPRRRPQ